MDLSDDDLIARVLDGDEVAFEVLYARYFKRVFNFTHKRLSNRADAEETVQEVFVNLFSSIGSFRGEAPFAAWVLGLTRRTIASRFKKKRHPTVPLESDDETERSDLSHPTVHREPSPLEQYECRERMARIEEAVANHLTPEQRDLFQRHHLEHHSIHDLARAFEKTEDAVKANLYRARKLLLAR